MKLFKLAKMAYGNTRVFRCELYAHNEAEAVWQLSGNARLYGPPIGAYRVYADGVHWITAREIPAPEMGA